MNGDGDRPGCEQQIDAAAYALGALDAPEADRYQRHLGECAFCRAELTDLQAVADLLAGAAPHVGAPERLHESIMTTVRAEADLLRAAGPQADRPPAPRRRWAARRPALVATVVALGLGVALGALVLASEPPRTRVIAAAVASVPGGRAQLLESDGRAELVVSGMPQPPAGDTYQVWLTRPHGTPQPTDALFSVTSGGRAAVDVPGGLHAIRRLTVTAEPQGGSRHPTSPPIVTATL